MHFEPNRYRKFGIASTGKARGFQPPALASGPRTPAGNRAEARAKDARLALIPT